MAKNKDTAQIAPEQPPDDPQMAVVLRADNAYEYNVTMPQSILEDILDPETPTRFIPVLAYSASGVKLPGVRRYLNTLYIKEIDVRG